MFKLEAKTITRAQGLATLLFGISCAIGSGACGAAGAGAEEDVASSESALLGPAIGPAGHRLQYFFCAQENTTCPLGTRKYVAFGANGSYAFKSVTGSVGCDVATFGFDPAPGQAKNCYFANYGFTAGENTNGRAPIGAEVAYGANGVFNFRKFTTTTFACSNVSFGDPVPGVVKSCYIAASGYNRVAGQNATFSAGSGASVAYGANGNFFFKILSGSASCTNATFGGDPAVGVSKDCYSLVLNPPIAVENQSYNLSGVEDVIYTSGLDGNTLSLQASSGVCSNAAFGGDPDLFNFKQCYAFPIIP